MTRMKSVFAVLLLTAIVSVVPQAHAQTVKVVLARSDEHTSELQSPA